MRFHAILDTESWYDFLYVEAATDPSGPWVQVADRRSGYLDRRYDDRLPAQFDNAQAVYVRIRFSPDDQYDGNGVWVDDFTVECTGKYSKGSFQSLSGTSMATPHVSGVTALVLARHPEFTTAQLRSKLLANVDRKASLAGKVATGGRINAYKAVK